MSGFVWHSSRDQVNDDYHENQTPKSMLSLIEELAKQA